MRILETRTATGSEHFSCQDRIVSQIFILLISNGEMILSKVNVIVWGQVKSENSSLPVAVRVSETRVLKLPNYTSDSLWKIWFVESIQSIHKSLWTWQDKCNICCRYCIYYVKFNLCLATKPLGVFSSETKWLNASLLFLRMNYMKNV